MELSNHCAGFTLMELIMVLALIAIITTLALPNSTGFIDDNRLRGGANDLVASMQIARAEAVGRNAPITLCKKNTAGTDCVTAGGWHQGWLVFVDADRDATVDNGDEILQLRDVVIGDITLYGTTGVADFITFLASGQTSVTSTQVFIFCDHRGFGTDAKGLLISILGRASVMPGPSTGQTSCLVP